MASANGVVIIKVPSRDLCFVALASEAARVPKGVWTGSTWEQRMAIMKRFSEFTKKRGPGMSEGRVPPFIVSLNLAKSGGAQCARAPLSLIKAGGADSDVSIGPSEGSGGNCHDAGAGIDEVGSERGRVATPFARAKVSRWGDIALLLKENFVEHQSDPNALIVDRGALPKTFEADPHRAARCAALAAAGAVMVTKAIAKMTALGRFAALGKCAAKRILQPYGMTANSVKGGALASAAAAVMERGWGMRIPTKPGERAGPLGLPRSAARCQGHWAAILNSSAKLVALVWRARGAWPDCPGCFQRLWAEMGRQARFLMGAAFCGAPELLERPPRRNSSDWRCGR
ncbi:hypothetical protein TRVL_09582 [Trypanosoma vivax]|nr:hypothetical protein TRVL_09582 [Trypanosoma vivax]